MVCTSPTNLYVKVCAESFWNSIQWAWILVINNESVKVMMFFFNIPRVFIGVTKNSSVLPSTPLWFSLWDCNNCLKEKETIGFKLKNLRLKNLDPPKTYELWNYLHIRMNLFLHKLSNLNVPKEETVSPFAVVKI